MEGKEFRKNKEVLVTKQKFRFKFAFGSVVSEFLFLICIKKWTAHVIENRLSRGRRQLAGGRKWKTRICAYKFLNDHFKTMI